MHLHGGGHAASSHCPPAGFVCVAANCGLGSGDAFLCVRCALVAALSELSSCGLCCAPAGAGLATAPAALLPTAVLLGFRGGDVLGVAWPCMPRPRHPNLSGTFVELLAMRHCNKPRNTT